MKSESYDPVRRWGCLALIVLWVSEAALIVLLCIGLCSCSPRTVYVPVETAVYRTDTVYAAKVRTDSVIVRDSVAVIQRGDTVTIAKYRDRLRVIESTDTVYRSLVDSVKVAVPYPVERKLSRWEQTKQDAGGMAIGAVCAIIILAAIYCINKLRRKINYVKRR